MRPELFDVSTGVAEARWKRAVDLLWREVVRLRRVRLEARERERARRRLKNLRRIVRKALSEYHAIALARQKQEGEPGRSAP